MGQYYYVVNLDKREYLHPHRMGDGLKLLEFGSSGRGTMLGLAVLLADGNGRGGGDLRSNRPIVGSWAGDRIVIAGDYADEGNFVTEADLTPEVVQKIRDNYAEPDREVMPENVNLHLLASVAFREVSGAVREALAEAGEGSCFQLPLIRAGWGS